MTLPVSLRGSAERDIEEIEDWYELQRVGLGAEFRATLDGLFSRLSEHPEAFPVLYRENRRAVLRGFPFNVWFRVLPDRVLVLTVIHGRRRPRLVRERLESGA